jgi:hypothetical protein
MPSQNEPILLPPGSDDGHTSRSCSGYFKFWGWGGKNLISSGGDRLNIAWTTESHHSVLLDQRPFEIEPVEQDEQATGPRTKCKMSRENGTEKESTRPLQDAGSGQRESSVGLWLERSRENGIRRKEREDLVLPLFVFRATWDPTRLRAVPRSDTAVHVISQGCCAA